MIIIIIIKYSFDFKHHLNDPKLEVLVFALNGYKTQSII